MPEKQTARARRVRPSRARGLRTSTGCLTCRKRRVKCDEKKPKCSQCGKADRDCRYPGRSRDESPRSDSRGSSALTEEQETLVEQSVDEPEEADSTVEALADPLPAHALPPVQGGLSPFSTSAVPLPSVSFQIDQSTLGHAAAPVVTDPPVIGGLDAAFSPFTGSQHSLLNISPFEWYDLLAQDAITQIQRQAALNNGEQRWAFDETALSRRQSPVPFPDDGASTATDRDIGILTEPWNTLVNIELSPTDRSYLEYYIDIVGPILDLFDPDRHFTNVVPHLAIRNVGLLKSILAVAARHKSIGSEQSLPAGANPVDSAFGDHFPPTSPSQPPEHTHYAAQYYYETLQYLSQNLLYPSYADSLEILATAIMISTYEMFDPQGAKGDLERHLRGSFWIQRCQDNNGESLQGLKRAVWWAWLRQDTWVAFRAGRPTLTIWRPVKRLEELNSNERATRILYIAAKCVEYAAGNTSTATDIQQRIDHGNRLLQTLSDWYTTLPPSYRPLDHGLRHDTEDASILTGASGSTPGAMSHHASETTGPIFQPIWMHPPNHAGAMQMYHFARAAVLLNQPTTGGVVAYRRRQRTLNESLHTICGIANASRPTDHAMAFVNVQAVYAIGQCVQMREKQAELVEILNKALSISRFPATSLVDDLKMIWQEAF
ncbi:hypothetical protein F5X68DRAFT_258467 [Plectosphaerella plurivora]|uniref:Zn(2)-C6 fungal-type domain-containing protein n=1 Tax=Plectosphaerella plurivora TaxID=936078 RepID=A0A9P8VJL4_9PEZI|nr:hypothetical protein F5X68DRAFT_258467 [Plectosphaerella plurivora]